MKNITKRSGILSTLCVLLSLSIMYGTNMNWASASIEDDDPYDLAPENNDDLNSAAKITMGLHQDLILNDNDWYNITMGANEVLRVVIDFNESIDYLNFQLYDHGSNSIGYPKDEGEKTRTLEYLSYSDQFLYIKVYSSKGYIGGMYNMSVESFNLEGYDDKFEENDNIVAASANVITPDHYNYLFQRDEDYYKIWVEFDYGINVMMNYDGALASMGVKIVNELGIIPTGSWDSGNGGFHQSMWSNDDVGQYVYVYVQGDNSSTFYGLEISVRWLADDYYEENDDFDSSEDIGFGFHDGLVQYDDDWYHFMTGMNQQIDISLEFNSSESSMGLSLYNESGDFVMDAMNYGSKLHLSYFHSGSSQNLYLNVSGDNLGAKYSLEVLYPGFDDGNEDYDTFATAMEEYPGTGYPALYQNDEEWYHTSVDPQSRFTVTLRNSSFDPNFKLELFNASGDYLYSGQWETDWEGEPILKAVYNNTEDYSVEIYWLINGSDFGMRYGMDVGCYLLPAEDEFEDNDLQASALELNSNQFYQLGMFDDDWFWVTLGPGDVLNVTLYFDIMKFALHLELYDALGNHIKTAAWNNDLHITTFEYWNMENHDVNMSLYIWGDNEQMYGLELRTNYEEVPQTDDLFEDNDFEGEASEIDLPFYNDTLVFGDEDWFNFSVPADTVVHIYTEYMTPGDILDFNMKNSSGDMMGSWTTQNNNHFIYDSQFGGTLILQIFTNGAYNFNQYSLSIWFDDKCEDNDNLGEAFELHPDYWSNLYCADDDWYSLWVDMETNVTLYLNFDGAHSLSFDLYGEYGTQLATGFEVNPGYWQIDYEQGAAGTYLYIHVSGEAIFYDLDIWTYGPMYDDWAEENDYQSESYFLNWGNHSIFHNFDDDWYELPGVVGSDRVTVFLEYDTMTTMYIELYDSTGNPHGYSISNYTGGKELSWTATGSYNKLFLLVWGENDGDWYSMDIELNGQSGPNDDQLEENDAPSDPYALDGSGRWDNLMNFDDDYYALDVITGDIVTVELWCDHGASLVLAITDTTGAQNANDMSTDDGNLIIEFEANASETFMFRVTGDSTGEWYNLEVRFDNTNSSAPSLEWVTFNEGDFWEYSVILEFDDDGGPRGTEKYNGTFRIEITSLYTTPTSVHVDCALIWINLPIEFVGTFPTTLSFEIHEDGMVSEGAQYFGIVPLLMGANYFLNESAIGLPEEYDFFIYNSGNAIDITYLGGVPWWHVAAEFSDTGLLKHLIYELEMVDTSGTPYGKLALSLDLLDTIAGTGGDDNGTTNSTGGTEDPFDGFDLSSIPGYTPYYLIGSGTLTMIALFFVSKRRRS